MKEIWIKADPWKKKLVTTALESGAAAVIVPADKVEEVKELAKEDILDMLGIELGPVRLKCALLPLKVLKAGVYGIGDSSDSD